MYPQVSLETPVKSKIVSGVNSNRIKRKIFFRDYNHQADYYNQVFHAKTADNQTNNQALSGQVESGYTPKYRPRALDRKKWNGYTPKNHPTLASLALLFWWRDINSKLFNIFYAINHMQ